MAKNTSMSLGQHFEHFIADQVEQGRYHSASEVVRAGLRLLEEHEQKIYVLRQALEQGEQSGIVEYSYESFIAELDKPH